MRQIFILFMILLMVGCSAKYQLIKIGDSPGITKIKKGESILISVPSDGYYGAYRYANSGRMTAQAIKNAFSRYTNNVKFSSCSSMDKCLQMAIEKGYVYLVFPEIMHWEDRATEWSGKPDRIEIKIIVIDVLNKKEISSVIIKGRSKWLTFGGDHPQDLLSDPINAYVSTLF